jgi:ubiquinone biosynthesis protein Coq4
VTGRVITEDLAEAAARALLGCIDTGDGGTAEQRALLAAVVSIAWGRPDLSIDELPALSPAEAAAALPTRGARRRVGEIAAALELCRHPLTDAQVALTESLAETLGHSGPDIGLARALVHQQAALALADLRRFEDDVRPAWSERTLVQQYLDATPEADAQLLARLRSFADLPDGSLGRAYLAFYEEHGIQLPGDDATTPAFFVGHDMNHVIAGYGTTAPEEIALSAMLVGISDDDPHWIILLAGLMAYEVGLAKRISGKTEAMARPGAADMFADAMRRGAQCTADFSVADHLALVELPLDEVRARFGVPPRVI